MNQTKAEVVADSLSPAGVRLTSIVVQFPRCIAQELLRHRVFSFSAASSRAVPAKLVSAEEAPMFVPEYVGKNQAGMTAKEEVESSLKSSFQAWVQEQGANMRAAVQSFSVQGVHKQHVNRYLEPYSYTRLLVTGTDWKNFFELRCHPAADPVMQDLAQKMYQAYHASVPQYKKEGQAHLPFIRENEFGKLFTTETLALVSSARCARLSYDKFGTPSSMDEDIKLAKRLLEDKHMSPFEHQAFARKDRGYGRSNLKGWTQFRKTLSFDSYDTEKKSWWQQAIAWVAVRTGSL